MSQPPRRRSGQPHAPEEPQDAGPGPFDHGEHDRYRAEGTLGRGGMGEVLLHWDERLGREVALKVANNPEGEAALVREARLTARLDHPGIVPVHGAGRLPDGRAYYTMPVLPGRSLAQNQGDRAGRIRHLLDACRAVAHAHAHGVLHRDLKPENLLIGTLGETLVADWGLATVLRDGRTQPDGCCGTAPYASPEQQRGEALTPASDVFSLGRMLQDLAEDEAELLAVAERATWADPTQRYGETTALADELLAWFEGRRVQAYDYSPQQLLRRTVVAWRVPLGIAAVALAAIVVAVTVSGQQVVDERNRAVQAEAQSRGSLASALVSQALAAAERNERASAELLAAEALTLKESPAARGVLARFLGRPRPQVLSRRELPNCRSTEVSVDGAWMACLEDQRVTRVNLHDGSEEHLAASIRSASVGTRGVVWLTLDDGSLNRWTTTLERYPSQAATLSTVTSRGVLSMSPGAVTHVAAWSETVDCDGLQAILATLANEVVTVVCSGTSLQDITIRQGFRHTLVATLSPGHGPPSALASEGDILALGTEGGALFVGPTEALELVTTELSHVRDLALQDGLVAVAEAQGGVTVWDVARRTRVASLPSGPATVRWLGPGRLRVLDETTQTDWSLPSETRPHRLRLGAGIAGLDVDEDRVATAHGDGLLMVHGLQTGEALLRVALGGVVKDVAFSPDGTQLLAGSAVLDGARLLDAETGAIEGVVGEYRVRRVAWASQPVVGQYGLTLWAREAHKLPSQVLDLEPAGDAVVALLDGGGVFRVAEGPTRIGGALDAVAVAGVEGQTVVATSTHLKHLDTGIEVALEGRPVELAMTEDLVAVGLLDGSISLRRSSDLVEVAVCPGHTGRAATLAFEGDWLVSGGWDGDVRSWSLKALDPDPDRLLQELQAAWGL